MISKGYRRKTRSLFSKDFKKHGLPNTSKYIHQYRVGDLVDCKVDPSVVKGMPHKYYHGKTGRVYNTNPHSAGVVFFRKSGGKILLKPVNVRIEHLTPSRSNEDTAKRYREYGQKHAEAKAEGITIKAVKRQPKGPRRAFAVSIRDKAPIEVSVVPPARIF
jgi:large subunit ribosomal protein L21e